MIQNGATLCDAEYNGGPWGQRKGRTKRQHNTKFEAGMLFSPPPSNPFLSLSILLLTFTIAVRHSYVAIASPPPSLLPKRRDKIVLQKWRPTVRPSADPVFVFHSTFAHTSLELATTTNGLISSSSFPPSIFFSSYIERQ